MKERDKTMEGKDRTMEERDKTMEEIEIGLPNLDHDEDAREEFTGRSARAYRLAHKYLGKDCGQEGYDAILIAIRYVRVSKVARKHRLSGSIQTALKYEAIAEGIYREIPKKWRW